MDYFLAYVQVIAMLKKRAALHKHISIGRVSGRVEELLRRRFALLERRGQLSKAHDIVHVRVVSFCAREIAKQLALKNKKLAKEADIIAEYAAIAGWLHDIVRKATEEKPHGIHGAKVIRRYAKMYPHIFKGLNEEALKRITDIVEIHELSLKEIEEKIKDWPKEWQIVARAVVIGDKLIEASGERVIERRAFFVGNERLHRGDLQYLKKIYGKKAPLYAVAMESCMRLRARNIVENYPKEFQPIVKKLHAVQEEFYLALLKHLGLTEEKLFEEMKRIKFPKFEKYEKVLEEQIRKANSAKKIKRMPNDVVKAAVEWVMRFSKAKSPEEAIEKFKPKSKKAKEWLEAVKALREGEEKFLGGKIAQLFR